MREMKYKNQATPPASTVPAPNPLATPEFEEIEEGNQLALISDMRQLWSQLAIWSRALVVSVAANLSDIQMITDRLMFLPEAFSKALGKYFEPQDADRFGELLQEHISTISALFTAEKDKDDALVNQETENLYANADRMAEFLAGINSYWDEEQWKDLLSDYIEMLLAGLVARMAGEYAKEIDIFDDLQTQALKIADYMSRGIMRKFHP